MKRRKNSKLLLGLLVAIVSMGIGYAAIAGIGLLINGNASLKANGNNEDFKVRFVRNDANETAIENPVQNAITFIGKHEDGTDMDTSGFSASVTDDTHAAFDAGDMETVGDYAEFTYTVVNESDAVDAMLSFDVSDVNDEDEYFEVTKDVNKAIIGEGETTTVKVKVKLIKVPTISDTEANFTVTLTASPVDEEDTSGSITGTTQEVASASSFAKAIQNNNIDTIELDKDITIDKNANLKIDDNTTIDFNGNTLTVEPGSIKVVNGAELVLSDDTGNGGIQASNDAVTVKEGSEVIVESGTYETTEFTGRGAVIKIPAGEDNAKITVNGGTINGDYFAIASYGDSEIEINGGEMNSTATVKNGADSTGRTYHAYAVKLNSGHITMNGGSINGIHGGLALEGDSSATINNGTITLNNSYEGAKDSYYCLYVNGTASAEVNNGTFTNNGTNPLVYSSSTGLVNLRGGVWTGKSANAFNGSQNAGRDSIKVYGGTYKKNTSGTLTDYNVSAYAAN